ncbi:MAG TPA: hypothetical protein VH642_05905, partial [Streptosporangiaceae bacterium]
EFLADARRVADAILYEGYLLYPYRGSARKNQSRFQFGVLMPPAYRDVDASEPSVSQTECLLEGPDEAQVTVIARFLHLQRRQVEVGDGAGGFRPVASVQVDDAEVITWDEAAEREHRATVPLAALLAGGVDAAFEVPGGESTEALTDRAGRPAGRLTRRQAPLAAVIRLRAERLPGPYGALRLRLTIENRTSPDGPLRRREDGLRFALIATHALIHVPGGRFLSLTDPPEWRRRTPRRASTWRPGRSWPARRNAGNWCSARRSSSTTTRGSPPRARASCSIRPRSTRSSPCARWP